MDNKDRSDPDKNWLKDLPATLENPGFAAEELLKCSECGRANPPNRFKCIYCAADLELKAEQAAQAKLSLRKLEPWEKGFNVIALPRPAGGAPVDLPAVARELGLAVEEVAKLIRGAAMPVARVEGETEVGHIVLRLKDHGIQCRVLSDEALDPDRSPRRIRALEFQGDSVVAIDFNTGERIVIPKTDLLLLVAGLLFEVKTASIEKRKKGKAKLLDRSEMSSDETVIDLYFAGDRDGLRIHENGFDFSCLGADKGLLAADNMPRLMQKLSKVARLAKVADQYLEVHDGLDLVWEPDSRKDFEGLQRSGFGKTNFGHTVTLSNLRQFNRYSRMQQRLL